MANSSSSVGPVRIFLICSFQVFRSALRSLLESHVGFQVVGEAAKASEALARLNVTPNLFLCEYDADAEVEIGFLPKLLEAVPGTRAVILTGDPHPELHARAVRLGAMGVVGKNEPPALLMKAIEQVHLGETWLEPATVARVLGALLRPSKQTGESLDPRNPERLTIRERQVVSLVGEALSNRQIAKRLHISEITVRHHLTSVFSKLDIRRRVELAQFAYLHGLARLAPNHAVQLHRVLF